MLMMGGGGDEKRENILPKKGLMNSGERQTRCDLTEQLSFVHPINKMPIYFHDLTLTCIVCHVQNT